MAGQSAKPLNSFTAAHQQLTASGYKSFNVGQAGSVVHFFFERRSVVNFTNDFDVTYMFSWKKDLHDEH